MNADTAYPRNPPHLIRYMSNAVRAAVALSEGKNPVLWDIDRRFAAIRKEVALAALMVTVEHEVEVGLPRFIWEAWERWSKIPDKEKPEAWADRGLDLVFDSLCESISGDAEAEKALLWAGSHFAIGKGLPLDFAQPGDDVIIRKPGSAPWSGTFLGREQISGAKKFVLVLCPDSKCPTLVEPAHVGLVLFNMQQRLQFRRRKEG